MFVDEKAMVRNPCNRIRLTFPLTITKISNDYNRNIDVSLGFFTRFGFGSNSVSIRLIGKISLTAASCSGCFLCIRRMWILLISDFQAFRLITLSKPFETTLTFFFRHVQIRFSFSHWFDNHRLQKTDFPIPVIAFCRQLILKIFNFCSKLSFFF